MLFQLIQNKVILDLVLTKNFKEDIEKINH